MARTLAYASSSVPSITPVSFGSVCSHFALTFPSAEIPSVTAGRRFVQVIPDTTVARTKFVQTESFLCDSLACKCRCRPKKSGLTIKEFVNAYYSIQTPAKGLSALSAKFDHPVFII